MQIPWSPRNWLRKFLALPCFKRLAFRMKSSQYYPFFDHPLVISKQVRETTHICYFNLFRLVLSKYHVLTRFDVLCICSIIIQKWISHFQPSHFVQKRREEKALAQVKNKMNLNGVGGEKSGAIIQFITPIVTCIDDKKVSPSKIIKQACENQSIHFNTIFRLILEFNFHFTSLLL